MRILLPVALFSLFIPLQLRAESDVQCPYEAVVDADDLHVRSGPGTRYYPTGKLQSGQKVTVRRLDPGGWLMIDPPEGTFSLIPAAAVERTGEASGTVTEDEVKVVMGSEQNLSRAVTQCELNQGDSVEILGEKILSLGGPSETWYQIRPPQGEYRWVHGKYIVPVDGIDSAKQIQLERKKADALRKTASEEEVTSEHEEPASKEPTPPTRKPRIDKSGAVAQTGPDLDVLVAEREQLKAIDREWELMLDRSPSLWKLDDMEQAYRQLQEQLTIPVLKKQIDYRLSSLKEYRQVYGDFVEFQQITEATDRRDRELRDGFVAPVVQPTSHEAPAADSEIPPGAFPDAAGSSGEESANPLPLAKPEPAAESALPANPNQFVLTGRLVRTTPAGGRAHPGNPAQFAIVAPNNQIQAFLHSTPQVGDLSPYLNREVGINGSNWSRPGQQSNVYSVTQIAPLDGPLVRDSSTPQFAMPTQQPGLAAPMNGPPGMSQQMLSQGNPQQPQTVGTPVNGYPNQPIPSQFGNGLPGGIQPVNGEFPQTEFPQTTGPMPQESYPQQPVNGYPIPGENKAFSAYPPNQMQPGFEQHPTGQMSMQQLQQIEQHFGQPSGQGQWQPATQMHQPHLHQQQGQAYQQGNVIHRPPQYSNQKRSWWPFGRHQR